MMRRPVVVERRRPGLMGTMARTAVVAGTATAVSKSMNAPDKEQQAQAAQEQQATQQQLQQMQAQMATMQAQQAMAAAQPAPSQPAPQAAANPDLLAQIQQLTQLKESGALTDAEFQAAKAKLLGG